MPKNIGPRLLEELEAKRSTMSEAEYTARRLEVEERIRTGKAVEYTAGDRLGRLLIVLIGLPVSVVAGSFLAQESPIVGLVVGLVLFIGTFVVASKFSSLR